MLLSIESNRPRRHRPRVTGIIIVLNMLIYLSALVLETSGGSSLDAFMSKLSLSKGGIQDGHLWQLLTYQFAHSPSGLFHLGVNMLFLWIFGSALEDRLGHVNFALFFIMGGIVSGIAHLVVSNSPVIGASGAVCAVTGGFIMLSPSAIVRVGRLMFPAMWIVAFQILQDLLGMSRSTSNVAHSAHLAGYLFGFFLITVLLLTRIVKSDQQDLIYLFKQNRRRAHYRRVVQESQTATFTQQRDSKPLPVLSEPDRDPEEARQRSEILKLIRTNAFKEAQDQFRLLQANYPESVLPEAMQLEIANRIQADGDRDTAAVAYERFLKRYPSSRQAPEVRLLLAVLLVRFLNRSQEAIPLLKNAATELTSDSHRKLAEKLLDEAGIAKEPSS